jgi:cardiolipin synthase
MPRTVTSAGRWLACACLLGGLAGCQATAARFTATDGEAPGPPRARTLACQVVRDTGTELGRHPLRCSAECLAELADHLGAAGQGLLCKRLGLNWQTGPGPTPARYDLADARIEPADVRLYIDGGSALGELHQLIAGATCRIDVLMFEWDNDPLGMEVATWLAHKAGPNLRVRVLIDGGGNLLFGHPAEAAPAHLNRVVCWLSRQPYVEVVRIRNPFARFDHRKLVVVDGRHAWTGGRNFTYEAFFVDHDLSFTVEGPLVDELEACFEQCWREQGEGPAAACAGPDVRPALLEANAWASLVRTRPCAPGLARTVYHAVEQAQGHVYLENYGLYDSRLLWRLAAARRRGADVRVLLPRASYTHAMTCANRVAVNRLLHAGVRVYLYPGATHVKALTVDGCWAYLGTGNFDALSMRHNHELGLAISAGPVLQEVEERLFLADFRPEWEVSEPLPLSLPDYVYELAVDLAL